MSDIARRLIEPARRLSLEALARDWFTLAVAGYGAHAHATWTCCAPCATASARCCSKGPPLRRLPARPACGSRLARSTSCSAIRASRWARLSDADECRKRDPFERLGTVFARLARRVEDLALWQDAAIDADWRGLARAWHDLSYDLGQLRRIDARVEPGCCLRGAWCVWVKAAWRSAGRQPVAGDPTTWRRGDHPKNSIGSSGHLLALTILIGPDRSTTIRFPLASLPSTP